MPGPPSMPSSVTFPSCCRNSNIGCFSPRKCTWVSHKRMSIYRRSSSALRCVPILYIKFTTVCRGASRYTPDPCGLAEEHQPRAEKPNQWVSSTLVHALVSDVQSTCAANSIHPRKGSVRGIGNFSLQCSYCSGE